MAEIETGIDGLILLHSGADVVGYAQVDGDACLGGNRSITRADVLKVVSRVNQIPNIKIDYVLGACGVGLGTLTAVDGNTLAFAAPGGTQGADVAIANGETKVLVDGTDGDAGIVVTRRSDVALAGSETFQIAEVMTNVVGGPGFSSAEATAGGSKYGAAANSTAGDEVV